MELKFTKLSRTAKSPEKKGHDQDPLLTAGIDLYSDTRTRINTQSVGKIKTGIALQIPRGYFGLIKNKSGAAYKQGYIVNAGVIDANYRGEIQVVINNAGNSPIDIMPGDAIAQLLILPVPPIELVEVEELSETERGAQGFNSTADV